MDWSEIKNALKKGAGSAAKLAGKGAKIAAKGIAQAADELEHQRRVIDVKRRAVERFSLKQMKHIANEYNLGSPFIMQEEPTRNDWIDLLVQGIESETLFELVSKRTGATKQFITDLQHERKAIDEWYQKRKIERWQEKGQTEEQAISQEVPKQKEIVDFLGEQLSALPEKIYDERHLHDVLFGVLKASGRFKSVEQEVREDNQRPDIIVDGIVIEVKVPKNRTALDSAYFQAQRYKFLSGVTGVILFIYAIDSFIYSLADEYDNKFANELGLVSIISKGDLRNPKIKWRYPKISFNVQYK
jgi:hypothetical protein